MKRGRPEALALLRWAADAAWPRLVLHPADDDDGLDERIVGPGRDSWFRFLTETSLASAAAALEAAGLPVVPVCVEVRVHEHPEVHPTLTATTARERGFGRRIFRDELGFGWIHDFDPNDDEPCACCGASLEGGWFGVDEIEDDELPDEPMEFPAERVQSIHDLCVECVSLG